MALNSSSSATAPGAGVSARRDSGAGVVFWVSISASAVDPEPAGFSLLENDDDVERGLVRWKPYSLIQVRIVRVIRFLFSAMIASADLGGELGVVRLFSDVDVERRDGGWTCCDARRDGGSRKGFGVAVRF